MESLFGLAPLILIFPVIGVLFNGLVGRRFVDHDRKTGERWSGWFATIMALSAFVVVVLLNLALHANHFHAETVMLWDWIVIPGQGFSVPWAMQIDTLSVAMMLVVTGVGSIIHIYSIGYMHGDPDYSRYFAYLNLFLFFMLILVAGNNYLVLFVGWEGVGLCSYLLIGFWHERLTKDGVMKNANAARKAMIVNRIGDAAMILGIILTFWVFGSVEFNHVFEEAIHIFESHEEMVTLVGTNIEMAFSTALFAITILFLVAATGKSAQLVLHVWLPDAMAGPTPASALIHAATMVTSGIYLIVRSNVLYEISRALSVESGTISSGDIVALVGAATALYAGLIAFTQYDIKKVLAYSTVSQLGFMIAAAGMGAYVAAMFHLITHAFFKALLFMAAGSVIHGMEHGHHEVAHGHHGRDDDDGFDPQDMRYMGGLRHKMPVTFWTYLVGALALAGIFPFAGFWSKDEILAHANANQGEYGLFLVLFIMLALAAVCTAFYMGRQLRMVFWGQPRHEAAGHAHESSPIMTFPLVLLAVFGTVAGLFNLPKVLTLEFGWSLTLEHWLEHSIQTFELMEEGILAHAPHTPTSLIVEVAALSLGLALAFLGLAFYVYRDKPKTVSDPDPTQKIPGLWGVFGRLPIDTFYMSLLIPWFNRFSDWLGHKFEWSFWHDFFHERVIRDTFVWFADLSANVLDAQGVDGIVNGLGSVTRWLADGIRVSQTGYARTYALGVFLGTVALLIYFLWPYVMGQ
ncbi:MAG: NADH-quinone oxidoreductase subunit L [Anaerolineae bacterium]|nr:NADH-quinone oxidoreductase subunit L [Anaerolineae bacterium]